MNKLSKSELKKIVSTFVDNELFEKGILEKRSYEFENFPYDSCGASCEILLKYCRWLQELKFVESTGYISKNDPPKDWSSHTWLENKHWIIDVTAHQFNKRLNENFLPIIVCLKEDYPLEKYLVRYK